MFFIDELEDLKVYKKNFLLPLNEKNKRKNGACMLMGTDYSSSLNMMKYPLMTPKYYFGYYTEQAVMYYINQENRQYEMTDTRFITESLEDIIDNVNGGKVIFHGYAHDVANIRDIVTPKRIKDCATRFKTKAKFPINVYVTNFSRKRENTNKELYVLPESMYNRKIKSYEKYLIYNIYEMILLTVNPKIPREAMYALALYASGLYEMHKNNWIFGGRLKFLCKAIDLEAKHDDRVLIRYAKNPDGLYDSGKMGNVLLDKLSTVELPDFFDEDSRIIYSLNSDNIPLNETYVLSTPINEDKSFNSVLKRDLYADRMKTLNDLKKHYEFIKEQNPEIKYTFRNYDLYNGNNIFIDFAHYNMSFIKNNTAVKDRGYKIYNELMQRLICDARLEPAEYTKKSVLIPISDWDTNKDILPWMVSQTINPISCIYRSIMTNAPKLKEVYKDTTFVFLGENGYFKLNFNTVNMQTLQKFFLKSIKKLRDKEEIIDDDNRESSPKAITVDIVDKIEKSQGLEIDNVSTSNDEGKDKLIKTVTKAAEKNTNVEDALDTLDQDEELKSILSDLSTEADKKANISDARASRMIKLQDDLMDKQFKDKPIRELINVNYDEKELQEKSVKVDSVNTEWESLKAPTQEEVYNMDADIVTIFQSFTDKTNPLVIRDMKVENNSNTEDAVMLYTVSYENENGKRFTIKLDIPIWIDNKYLILRGNKKDIPNQLFLMPIIKTDPDTIQIVSNYNKIFIRRFGTTSGKSFPICDKLIKTLTKNEFKSLKVEAGDNTKICNRYELPIDYIDFASNFNKLTTPTKTIYFNQEELREKFGDKIDDKVGIPIGIEGRDTILYYNTIVDNKFWSFSEYLYLLLVTDNAVSKEGFEEAFKATSRSVRYTYSRASILSSNIPLIVICAYSEGLQKVLKKGNIKFRIEKDKRDMDIFKEDFVKFKDAVLIYQLDYASSLLMNGLKSCPTEEYSIAEIDSRPMYVDFLEEFGGRIKADGLDNFYDLMIDKPITYRGLEYYKLPTDYIEVLLYANRLLVDNKFAKHTQITNNRRIRRHEQIPAILYKVLSKSYEGYCNNIKHGRYAPMTIKQSAVIDEILVNSTTSDKSIINALSEYEAYASVTPKGPCGMNSDRSYTLDKRSFDESMLNVLGMSTGFAGNVGINRQLTIDSNISTARGYIKDNEKQLKNLSPTKSFCMTEALTPFGCTRDDPFRTAMTFVQTSKHGMRCRRSNPALITSGADEALPYLTSNIFSYKSKGDGVVKDVNEERMIVEYKDGSYEYIDLTEKVEKNSSSGFYVTLKLDTDLKPGNKVKKDQILAYDKSSFSSDIGPTDNIAYNIGTLAKIAILNTDEGYEDSAIISQDLSEAMTSDVILQKDISLTKETNVYNLVEKGQKIEEGDTLLITQSSFDEEDVNILLRNLAGDEDEITDLGRIPIKSKVTGVVQDIKIYRTVDIDELSPTLKKIVTKYEKGIKARKKEMESYNIQNVDTILPPTEKLPATGKLKNVDDGVKIEIYLKYEDKMSVGDKLIFFSANKGVVKYIIPKGEEPKSSYRPNEKIHSLAAEGSINRRMVGSIMINGGIYKGLIELSRHVKDILNIPYKDNLFE